MYISHSRTRDSAVGQDMYISHSRTRDSAVEQDMYISHSRTQDSAVEQDMYISHSRTRDSAVEQDMYISHSRTRDSRGRSRKMIRRVPQLRAWWPHPLYQPCPLINWGILRTRMRNMTLSRNTVWSLA